ncbi:hypothetical protein NMG29_24840 [Streptomyces cocklensis]|uniref:hypothetical protein n=1 Tax=Actinacidiphila cocklensis TaxID=887465 RepID=UPI0020425216|nr:hypothetical protein [Actinacidiphila cocklensis]MDD1061405.1 hypothetical protein [Actinacidiphila cocklensis]
MADAEVSEDDVPDGLLGWCLVANVSQEIARGEFGLELQRGTKHFAAGALLWIPPVPWDPGWRRVRAVGRHRGNTRRYVNMILRVDDLENFRVKGVYSEGLVRGLNGYDHDPATPRKLRRPWTRERAQSYADAWNVKGDRVHVDGVRHPIAGVPNPPPLEIELDGETLHLAFYSGRGVHYSRLPPPTEWVPEA